MNDFLFIFGLLFLFVIFPIIIASLRGPYFPNIRAFRGNRVLPQTQWIGEDPGYEHGQELAVSCAQDFIDRKPPKIVYWDAKKMDYVDRKEDLS